MIKAHELRIGNIVSSDFMEVGGLHTITAEDIYHLGLGSQRAKFLPIPIKPKILEKCHPKWAEFAENFHLSFMPDGIYVEQYSEGAELLPHIKYLHQLQNLIFSLTGEELTVILSATTSA